MVGVSLPNKVLPSWNKTMTTSLKKISIAVIAVSSLLLAIASQSQTLSSLVQPSINLSNVRNMQLSNELDAIIQRMDERLRSDHTDYEAQLLKGMAHFQQGQRERAIAEIADLSQRAPQFHLAHLIHADMLSSPFTPISDIGQPGFQLDTSKHEQLDALRQEVLMRWQANLHPIEASRIPIQLLNLNSKTQSALVVDKTRHRIYVYERQGADQPPRLVHDFYISTGRKQGNKISEGDLRTPEGIYFITSFIPDDKLPEKYGIGAFPTNYPNVFDQRQGKTGDGIWLHGTDRIYYSRPPLDSEGCVVLSNLDLDKIRHLIQPGITPMVITDKIEWLSESQWHALRGELLTAIDNWRSDWESLDVDRYLAHYSDGFWSGRFNLQSWRQYKQQVIKGKTYQKVALSDVSVFYYPKQASSGKEMALIKFTQNYQSNNFQSETSKQIYLDKEQGRWRIVYEGRDL